MAHATAAQRPGNRRPFTKEPIRVLDGTQYKLVDGGFGNDHLTPFEL